MGPLIMSVQGTTLNARERDLLNHPALGGVIFFSQNYHNKEQLADLASQIREVSPELILAVDHEGGRVQRFRKGFTKLPPMRLFGLLYDKLPERALQLIYATGRLVAMELGEIGINTGFSPVLDLAGGNVAIGDRALHPSTGATTALAREFILGLATGGLLPVGKHFPGHGTASGDTHTMVVKDLRNLKQIATSDMQVFSDLVDEKILPAIMPAHIIFPQIDQLSVTASEVWLKQILREEMGFEGLVFSDDLAMSGVHVNGGRVSAKRILDAGCDMVLVCNDLQLLQTVLNELSQDESKSYTRTLKDKWSATYQMLAGKTAERHFDAEVTRDDLNTLQKEFKIS